MSDVDETATIDPAGVSDTASVDNNGPVPTPFSPSTQQRVVRGRLLGLDIVNERFVREFRLALFNLIRRNADITTDSVDILGVEDFQRRLSDEDSLNIFSMPPLRGNGLLSIPATLIYIVVDAVFGGSGRPVTGDQSDRDFTGTENRMIQRLISHALPCYAKAWNSVYALDAKFERSELQVRFCNITTSPNESVVLNSFRIEIGDYSGLFTISLPYSMLEPIRETLNRPAGQRITAADELRRAKQLANNVTRSRVKLSATFTEIPSTIGQIADIAVGDILPIDLPEKIEASVDDVPVLKGRHGKSRGRHALRVTDVYEALSNEYGDTTDD